ncbi:lipopolysaccharide biosynthesis protein [Sphingobacterium sp. ML3W]|uniref:LPS biosynthesis protein n=1 Tax=Sphingobacterium sp. ML3W TaxID=1538644 RepID=UPI0004F6FE51|nr:LPS biosynthesis protein [Sphingobacterium sp. ML3W]AIM39174.1 lipopolysaccharide biosynthesis protein [Sphingobacterium sp. ML3W]
MNKTNEISLKELILIIKDWISFLLKKWFLFIISILVGASIGFLYSKFKAPSFTATTTFVLESGEAGGGGGLAQYAGIASMVGVDLGGSGGGIFQGDNLLELYKSRKMIQAALLASSDSDKNHLLIDLLLMENGKLNRWEKQNSDLVNIEFHLIKQKNSLLQRKKDSVLMEAVADINNKYLSVSKPDKKLSIIKVDVTSKNEVFSKEFNNALVKKVNDFYVQTKTKKSLNNIAILQHKTDSVRSVMNGNISTAAVILDATPNLNPTRQAQRLVPTQRSQFSAETNKAILGQLVQNLELSKMALLKEAPLIEEIDSPIYPLKIERVGALKGIVFGAALSSLFMFFLLVIYRIYKTALN